MGRHTWKCWEERTRLKRMRRCLILSKLCVFWNVCFGGNWWIDGWSLDLSFLFVFITSTLLDRYLDLFVCLFVVQIDSLLDRLLVI